MSSLIYCADEKEIFVATDTLATFPDGAPRMFTTKAFVVPHLRMIVCCTGIQGFLGRWFIEINDRMLVRGIDNLNFHAPKILPSLFRKYKDEYGIPENILSTVYHFGFSENDRLVHSYVYRSENNFVSEQLPYGIRVKPACKPAESFQLPQDLRRMMDEQRSIQESLPRDERVYIGGEIQAYHLTETATAMYICDQFDDFETTEQTIYANYDSQKKSP